MLRPRRGSQDSGLGDVSRETAGKGLGVQAGKVTGKSAVSEVAGFPVDECC